MDAFEKWWNGPNGFDAIPEDGTGIAKVAFNAGHAAGFRKGMRRAVEITRWRVKVADYDDTTRSMTSAECRDAILSELDK